MKTFLISPGKGGPKWFTFKPVEIEAESWKEAVDRGVQEGKLPIDLPSIQVLERTKENFLSPLPSIKDLDEEEEKQLAIGRQNSGRLYFFSMAD